MAGYMHLVAGGSLAIYRDRYFLALVLAPPSPAPNPAMVVNMS